MSENITNRSAWGRNVKVGQRVTVPYPWGGVPAEVIEDLGKVGMGGRRIVRVRTLEDMEEVRRSFDYPAEKLAPPED